MKLFCSLCVTLFIVLACINSAFADDAAKKKVLIDAVQYSVDVLEKKGIAGFEELKAFRFDGGYGYVFITDMDLVVIMHPIAPELLNKNCLAIKDSNGKYFGAEYKAKADKSGEGWTWYSWPNPAKNQQPELKCSYYKVADAKGKKVIVYAASYGITQQACQ